MLSSLLLLAAIVWPAGTQIIEREPVPSAKGPRELVLWMIKPLRHADEQSYCGTAVHGDYWEGEARLSLVDPNRIINTVILPPEFLVPFLVDDTVWHIPAGKTGKPKIIHLQDLTGEGKAAQFPVFSYSACGIANTAVAGYSAKQDQAVLYPIVTHNDESPWAMQIFSRKPVRPGHWDFVWSPHHGSIDYFREHVDFDPARQLFIRDPELVPLPYRPTFLPPGGRIIEQQLIDYRWLLALWMDKPRYFNPPLDSYGGTDMLYGPRWIGQAHLSLVDPETNRIVNTINLPADLPIPAAGYYSRSKLRRPILEMHDLTGEGTQGQFALLEYMNTSTNETRAYGYSPSQNRLVQYQILDDGKPELTIPVIFQQPQTSPGLLPNRKIRDSFSHPRLRQCVIAAIFLKSESP